MSLNEYMDLSVKKIKIDFPSSCNLRCVGCFMYNSDKECKEKIPVSEFKRLLDDAKMLGVKQLIIAGEGEPLIDSVYFFDVVEYATSIGIECIIYTNGSLITKNIAKKLYDFNASFFLKRNSMNHNKQNKLIGVKASKRMMKGLTYLLNAGFDYKRLALQSYISKLNWKDLCEVLKFCRENEIMPYFEDFVTVGVDKKIINKMRLTTGELFEAYKKYQEIDDGFGIKTKVYKNSRRYGFSDCLLKGLVSIDLKGNVKHCIFPEIYGNIYEENLKNVFSKVPKKCLGCSVKL